MSRRSEEHTSELQSQSFPTRRSSDLAILLVAQPFSLPLSERKDRTAAFVLNSGCRGDVLGHQDRRESRGAHTVDRMRRFRSLLLVREVILSHHVAQIGRAHV